MAKRRALRKGERVNTRKKSPNPKAKKVEKPEGMTIRWMGRDDVKLAKAVKRANAKAARLNEKGYKINKISVKGVKQNVRTRAEFNQLLKDIDRFTKRGSEKGKTSEHIWQHEINYYKMKHRTNEERKAAKLKEFQDEVVTSRGVPVGVRKTQTGKNKFMTNREHTLSPSNLNTNSRRSFNSQAGMINKHLSGKIGLAKARQYKESVMKAIINEIKDPNLAKMVALLDDSTFDKLSRTEIEMDIQFMYGPAEQKAKAKLLYDILSPYVEAQREASLKALKRKGVPESTLNKMRDLEYYEYANDLVSNFDSYTRTNALGEEVTHLKYNILDDESEIISKFGK